MSFLKYKFAVKVLAPILCAVVLITLKPFLRSLARLVSQNNRQRYLEKISAFGKDSDVGAGSLVVILICIVVYATISLTTEAWVGEYYSRYVALFFTVCVFYGYFFILFWVQATFYNAQEADK